MKLKTLFAAAFAVVGFCSTASAVTYPLPTDGSRLVGQNQVITIPEGNTQPLEYFAAEYQMGLSNMMEANPGVDTFLPKGYQPAEPGLVSVPGFSKNTPIVAAPLPKAAEILEARP